MGFVDDRQRDLHPLQGAQEAVVAEALRGDVDQLGRAVANLVQPVLGFLERQGAVDHGRAGAHARRQRFELIFHQGDQRRDDDGHPGQQHGRELEGERFAGAGRHDAEGIDPGQHAFDDLPLPVAQGGMPEIALQHIEDAWVERPAGGLGDIDQARGGFVLVARRRRLRRGRPVRWRAEEQPTSSISQSALPSTTFSSAASICTWSSVRRRSRSAAARARRSAAISRSPARSSSSARRESLVSASCSIASTSTLCSSGRAASARSLSSQPGGHEDVRPEASRIGGQLALQPGADLVWGAGRPVDGVAEMLDLLLLAVGVAQGVVELGGAVDLTLIEQIAGELHGRGGGGIALVAQLDQPGELGVVLLCGCKPDAQLDQLDRFARARARSLRSIGRHGRDRRRRSPRG